MDVVVASRAEHHAVGKVGAATCFPPADVMGLAVFGWRVAFGAPTVAFEQRESLRAAEHALGASEVKHFALVAEYFGDDPCVTGEASQLTHGDGGFGAVDGAQPVSCVAVA